MPEWLWLLAVWVVLGLVLALGLGRWFRWLRDG
jgi:hypothetical protein